MNDYLDEELMQRFCRGDTAAFQVLFETHRDGVFRFLRAVGGVSAEVAEDLVQEVFLRLIRHRDTYNEAMPFRPWLFTIARNCARTAGRRAAYRGTVIVHERDGCPAREPRAGTPTADEVCAGRELEGELHRCLGELSEAPRVAFVMRVLEEAGYGEIAELLGVSEATARQHVSRARKRLRETLTPYLNGER